MPSLTKGYYTQPIGLSQICSALHVKVPRRLRDWLASAIMASLQYSHRVIRRNWQRPLAGERERRAGATGGVSRAHRAMGL